MKKYTFPISIMIVAWLLSIPFSASAADKAKESMTQGADNSMTAKKDRDQAAAEESQSERMAAEKRIDSVIRMLKEGVAISNSIPASAMEKAIGIAVIPDWTKAALIAGGSYGSGVLSAKRDDGQWTDPLFVSLTGGSLGFQAGMKSSELILVFTDRTELNQLAKNEDISLGADARVTAGSMNKGKSTEITEAKILTFEKSSGLFAGAALDGTVLKIQRSPTLAYYSLPDNPEEARGYFGKENVDASLYSQIIDANVKRPAMSKAVVPDSAQKFKNALETFVKSIQDRSKQ